MEPSRRYFLHVTVAATALLAISRVAGAQTYPARPVRWVVGAAPAGAQDITARLIAQRLSARLGQPFVIENRPGASMNIATEEVVRSPPDGYTLLMIGPANTVNATLYDQLNFNFIRDIAPVAGLAQFPNVMLVNPSFPAATVPEFIAYAKANPGKINFGSAGLGSTLHMAAELFKMMAGIDMVHVAYRGGAPALTDLLGGQLQVIFSGTAETIEYIRAGKLRALAVTSAKRSPALPDIPTIAEFLPGYETGQWFGIGVPSGTPAEVIGKLNNEVEVALADSQMISRLADLGGTVLALSPSELSRLIAEETEKWGKVIRAGNIKPV